MDIYIYIYINKYTKQSCWSNYITFRNDKGWENRLLYNPNLQNNILFWDDFVRFSTTKKSDIWVLYFDSNCRRSIPCVIPFQKKYTFMALSSSVLVQDMIIVISKLLPRESQMDSKWHFFQLLIPGVMKNMRFFVFVFVFFDTKSTESEKKKSDVQSDDAPFTFFQFLYNVHYLSILYILYFHLYLFILLFIFLYFTFLFSGMLLWFRTDTQESSSGEAAECRRPIIYSQVPSRKLNRHCLMFKVSQSVFQWSKHHCGIVTIQ